MGWRGLSWCSAHCSSGHCPPPPTLTPPPQLDIESVEEDHSEITEEESFIQNALTMLDHRHSSEMDMLQRKMEELQRHYMQEKETLRVDLVQTLFNARKLQEGGHQGAVEGEGEGGGLSPAILQLQQQQQFIQQQIQAHLRQEQLQQQAPALAATTVYSPSPTMSLSAAGHLMQPVPARCVPSLPAVLTWPRYPYLGSQPQLVTLGNGQTVQLVQGVGGQVVAQPAQYMLPQVNKRHFLFCILPRHLTCTPGAAAGPPAPVLRAAPALPPAGGGARGGGGAPPRQARLRQRAQRAEQGRARAGGAFMISSLHAEPSCTSHQSFAPAPVQAKRDSFSDSGAEGSGTNTPTRGRTMTEGLLRFVQDGSVVSSSCSDSQTKFLILLPCPAYMEPPPLPRCGRWRRPRSGNPRRSSRSTRRPRPR